MSFEAINSVTAAEQEAKAAVAAAESKAKQLLQDAENAGKAEIEAARLKADGELQELRRRADEKYAAEAEELRGVRESRKAKLRAQAEAKLEEAAALIVERIVND